MSRPSHSALESARLYLVPATLELARADLSGDAALAAALGVSVPESWPPEHHSRPAVDAALYQLGDRAEHGWSHWYLVGRGPEEGLIGVCGFKGRPDSGGSVEIAYSIVEPLRRIGYATEAVDRLVAWAFTHDRVAQVTAETLPHLRQSIRVLEKNGFRPEGRGSEYGVVKYVLRRASLR